MAKAKQTASLNVVQLYPDQMNIYGDNGNAQIVCRRAELYGYRVKLSAYNSIADKDQLLAADIVLGGGGQDSGQRAILADLQKIKPDLLSLAESKLPMLMICGLYSFRPCTIMRHSSLATTQTTPVHQTGSPWSAEHCCRWE